MELSASEVWLQILDEARAALSEQAFRTWLAPTQAVSVSPDTLIVSTPNPFAVHWVEDKYSDLLSGIGERLYGTKYRLAVQYTPGGRAPDRPVPLELSSVSHSSYAADARSSSVRTGPGTAAAPTDRLAQMSN